MDTRMSSAVNKFVDTLLSHDSDTAEKVLYVGIDARVTHYSKSGAVREVNSCYGIHFLFHRPSSYTKVVLHVEKDGAFPRFNKQHVYEFKSDHDSCWRSDGVESSLFHVACKMVEDLVKQGAPELAWKEYSWFCNIDSVKLLDGRILIDRNNAYKVTLDIKEGK